MRFYSVGRLENHSIDEFTTAEAGFTSRLFSPPVLSTHKHSHGLLLLPLRLPPRHVAREGDSDCL